MHTDERIEAREIDTPGGEEIPADAHLHDDPLTDGRIAYSEGWAMIDVDSSGYLEIERDDERDTFGSDEEAVAFVREEAVHGSPYHVKAVARHDADAVFLMVYRDGAADAEAGLPLRFPASKDEIEEALTEIADRLGAGLSTPRHAEELERYERIAQDTKKEFSYDKHAGTWYWHDRDAGGVPEATGFPTRMEALIDAIGPYLEDEE